MHGKNRISIIGNLGRDPSLSLTRDEKKVCRFSVAVNERFGSRETTEWFQIVVFDKLAELCNQYLRKGSLIDVEGRVETRTVESAKGERLIVVNVVKRLCSLTNGSPPLIAKTLPPTLKALSRRSHRIIDYKTLWLIINVIRQAEQDYLRPKMRDRKSVV